MNDDGAKQGLTYEDMMSLISAFDENRVELPLPPKPLTWKPFQQRLTEKIWRSIKWENKDTEEKSGATN